MACGAPLGRGGGSGAAGSVYNHFPSPIVQETQFECHAMPKRSRVRRETILEALEEEEIVSEVQPELANTNPAEDEDGRLRKKQKRDHYRLKSYLICRSRAREREKFSGSYARMLSIVHEVAKKEKYSKLFVTARQEVLRSK